MSNQIIYLSINSTFKMDNFKLQHYITVYNREAELAETVQTVFKPNNNLKKKKNCKKTD